MKDSKLINLERKAEILGLREICILLNRKNYVDDNINNVFRALFKLSLEMVEDLEAMKEAH